MSKVLQGTLRKKRQPKAKGEYRQIRPRVTHDHYILLNSINVDASLSQNLAILIDDYTRLKSIERRNFSLPTTR